MVQAQATPGQNAPVEQESGESTDYLFSALEGIAGYVVNLGSSGTGQGVEVSLSAAPTTRSQWTTIEWAAQLINELNANGEDIPLTVNNLINVATWIRAENGSGGGWLTNNDPLNTTLDTSNFTYPDVQTGIIDTAQTLEEPQYAGILDALSADDDWQNFSTAVVLSPWSGDNYSGSTVMNASSPDPLLAWATGSGSNPTGALGQAFGEGSEPATSTGLIADAESLISGIENKALWERIGMGALGVGLLVVGLVIFLSGTKAGEKVESSGESALPLLAAA